MLYKIALHRYIFSGLIVFFFHCTGSFAQGVDTSSYGVPLINNVLDYQSIAKGDSLKQMIPLKRLITNIKYDLRYGTKNNFMHRRMYAPRPKETFLRLPAARALAAIQAELNAQGYGLKIFDAYRPYAVTVRFWELVKDERYVANPSKGSGHNRGLSVDLTVVVLADGKELDMGTGFDNFTDTAHQSFKALPAAVLKNRKLLTSVMQKHGFTALDTEWWHFSWKNDRNYEVLDLSFKKLRRAS